MLRICTIYDMITNTKTFIWERRAYLWNLIYLQNTIYVLK